MLLALAAATTPIGAQAAGASPDSGLANADFEAGASGETPPGWFVPETLASAGIRATVSTNQPRQGAQCLVLRWPAEGQVTGIPFANVMQRVDATPWQGKRIRVTAAIRVRGEEARAQMWLRVDRPSGIGAFDNMSDRPVVSADWTEHSITADVAADALRLNLGLMSFGGTEAGWDHIRIEVLATLKTTEDPARPLSELGLANVTAFARLLGLVRYFHPSDQAATNDWLAFTVSALREIEDAPDPTSLAARLEAAFRPVAPTVRVWAGDREPLLPAELMSPQADGSRRVQVWEHLGFAQHAGASGMTPYSARRLTLSFDETSAKPDAHPTNVFRAELGRGVHCFVPTALFEIPAKGNAPNPSISDALPTETVFDPGHRGARLATVMSAWNLLQHFYPYFEVIEVDWPHELQVALRRAAVDPDVTAFYQTLNRLVVAIHDGHGNLMGPGQPPLAPAPVRLARIEDRLVVVAVAPGVGELRIGDVVESIDGQTAEALFQRLTQTVSAASPGWHRHAASRLAWGAPGTVATFVVRGDGGVVRTVTVNRGGTGGVPVEPRPASLSEVRPGIMYADPTRLTVAEWQAGVPRLTQARGLVFDMRGYPSLPPAWLGHLSRTPLESAQWHTPKRHRPDQTDVVWDQSDWEVPPLEPRFTTNVVFLTDGRAISYAETLMGIVEAYRLGTIVGEPTAGTNGDLAQADLGLGYRLMFTGMKVLKHDGSRHHGVGIRPTVPVSRSVEGVRAGRDEQLERALELLDR